MVPRETYHAMSGSRVAGILARSDTPAVLILPLEPRTSLLPLHLDVVPPGEQLLCPADRETLC